MEENTTPCLYQGWWGLTLYTCMYLICSYFFFISLSLYVSFFSAPQRLTLRGYRQKKPVGAPRGLSRGPEAIYESLPRGPRAPEGLYGEGGIVSMSHGGGGICSQGGWGTVSLASLSQSNYSISSMSGQGHLSLFVFG